MNFRPVLVLLLGLSCLHAETARADFPFPLGHEIADSVLVVKSERRLYLLKAGRILKAFNVSLGLVPNGPKQREGDFRTPEGHYMLDGRKADSDISSRSTSPIPTRLTGRARIPSASTRAGRS